MALKRSSHNTEKYKRMSQMRDFASIAKFVASVVILVLLINTFVIQSYEVFGQSMHPTLTHGDRLIVSKVGNTAAGILRKDFVPKRGNIIIFKDPFLPSRVLIKRVVGLPGERVTLHEGVFTIYNREHPDGFNPDPDFGVDYPYTTGDTDTTVPDGQLFVVGDNRGSGGSLDSRNELSTIPTDNVIGTLVLRVFPLTELHLF